MSPLHPRRDIVSEPRVLQDPFRHVLSSRPRKAAEPSTTVTFTVRSRRFCCRCSHSRQDPGQSHPEDHLHTSHLRPKGVFTPHTQHPLRCDCSCPPDDDDDYVPVRVLKSDPWPGSVLSVSALVVQMSVSAVLVVLRSVARSAKRRFTVSSRAALGQGQ